MELEKLAAFVEYVGRPLTEDVRLILEKVQQLNFPISDGLLRKMTLYVGLWHLASELMRAFTYIAITWIVCETIITVLTTTPLSFR